MAVEPSFRWPDMPGQAVGSQRGAIRWQVELFFKLIKQ